VLQRNPNPYDVDVPAIPATVPAGGTVDWPTPIAGFEPADPDPAEDTDATGDADTPEPPRAAKTPTKRAAAPADNPKE
jgi:hypothetical protein